MNRLHNTIKYLCTLLILFLLLLIYTFLGYKNIIVLTPTINKFVTIIFGSMFMLITSYNLTKRKNKNGIILGLLNGILIISVLFVLTLLTNNQTDLSKIIKYLIYIFISIIGGIIGVNKTKDKWLSLVFFTIILL